MSTLKATNLQHASATSPNITLGSDGSVAVGGGNISPSIGMRNRIINGDMRIDQRNAGAAVTINSTANTYTLDRWVVSGQNTDGVFTVDQITDAPAGFKNSLRIAVTTADASITSGQIYLLTQFIEGFNVADLGFGSASAQTVTLSFWVRSSLSGTFGGALNNSDNNRNYPFTYTISSTNTWEYKTITIPGDTTGTWLSDSGRGITVRFPIGVASDRVATAGSWTGTSSVFGASGATNIISTLNATWDITGVQLEKGTVATPFEFRSIGQELALCQRYYEVGGLGSLVFNANTYNSAQFKVTKRSNPTVSISAASGTISGITVDPAGFYAFNSLTSAASWTAAIEL